MPKICIQNVLLCSWDCAGHKIFALFGNRPFLWLFIGTVMAYTPRTPSGHHLFPVIEGTVKTCFLIGVWYWLGCCLFPVDWSAGRKMLFFTLFFLNRVVADTELPFSGETRFPIFLMFLIWVRMLGWGWIWIKLVNISDTIYKPPLLFVSGKVIQNFLFYHQSPKICQVGIDANLKPLKCLKDQTEAAIATKPHICQLKTLLRVEKFWW